VSIYGVIATAVESNPWWQDIWASYNRVSPTIKEIMPLIEVHKTTLDTSKFSEHDDCIEALTNILTDITNWEFMMREGAMAKFGGWTMGKLFGFMSACEAEHKDLTLGVPEVLLDKLVNVLNLAQSTFPTEGKVSAMLEHMTMLFSKATAKGHNSTFIAMLQDILALDGSGYAYGVTVDRTKTPPWKALANLNSVVTQMRDVPLEPDLGKMCHDTAMHLLQIAREDLQEESSQKLLDAVLLLGSMLKGVDAMEKACHFLLRVLGVSNALAALGDDKDPQVVWNIANAGKLIHDLQRALATAAGLAADFEADKDTVPWIHSALEIVEEGMTIHKLLTENKNSSALATCQSLHKELLITAKGTNDGRAWDEGIPGKASFKVVEKAADNTLLQLNGQELKEKRVNVEKVTPNACNDSPLQ
jgi:hypothetical protein